MDLPMTRRMMVGGLASATAAFGCSGVANAEAVPPADGSFQLDGRTIRFMDLTHRLTRAFGFGQQPPRIELRRVEGSGTQAGMAVQRLSIIEHSGTHVDAPRHFAPEGASLGEIPLRDLIVPLAVIDLRERFALGRDAAVGRDDIERWEKRHGRLPQGCCVAMLSGLDPLADYPELFGGAGRTPRGPGFSPDVCDLLIARSVKGVAVDSLSLDTGPNMPAYPFHQRWLRSGRWGAEGMANLAAVPTRGATLLIGVPPLADATGLPIRAVALF